MLDVFSGKFDLCLQLRNELQLKDYTILSWDMGLHKSDNTVGSALFRGGVCHCKDDLKLKTRWL